jgi:beta-galactosidase
MLDRQLSAGLVHAKDTFTGVDAIIVPTFGFLTAELVGKLEEFVRRGGHLIASARTGIRDRHNKAVAQARPGLLARLLRCTVEESGGFREPLLDVVTDSGARLHGGVGYEIIRPRGATVMARWAMNHPDDRRQPHPAAGQPAVTQAKHGKGSATLLGLWIDEKNAGSICDWLRELFGWPRDAEAARGVAVTRRIKGREAFCFVLNHTPYTQEVRGLRSGVELISGKRAAEKITLAPYGVAVIAERVPARKK